MLGLVLESRARMQGVNMSARVTFLTAILLVAAGLMAPGTAAAACGGAISEFEAIVTSDANTGNLNKSVYNRIVAELGPVKQQCGAGHDAEASRGLAAIKSRHGYR
ncbi:MAG TPA: hypothetical protein VFC24_02645 [Casimicrobiaceae bacterium]|nr:hypothetical protein [Casimicrobiaceae bacterium]